MITISRQHIFWREILIIMSVVHYSIMLVLLCVAPCFIGGSTVATFREYPHSVNVSSETQLSGKKSQNILIQMRKLDKLPVDDRETENKLEELFAGSLINEHMEHTNSSGGFCRISRRRKRSKTDTHTNRPKSGRRHHRKLRSRQGSSQDQKVKHVNLNITTLRKSPYKNAVRVGASIFKSPGCMGYLLDNQHVLTAAHCIHDGKNFSVHLRNNNMRVTTVNNMPSKIRFIIYNITTARVPTGWLRSSSSGWKNYDYAILTLSTKNRPVLSTDNVKFGMGTFKDGIATHVSYTCYPFRSGRRFLPKKTTCKVPKNGFLEAGNRLITKCNSELGSSGSAVFMNTIRSGNIIAGIVSYRHSKYEVINILTSNKVKNICSMIAGDLPHRNIPTKLPETCRKNGYKKHQLLQSNYVSFSTKSESPKKS
ncbi:uncharacterized protein [Antedon mediterranea]|uniref:uncharacterized protein n=1 Tax=Antedon mediterranea TaxID=105859 RepID=UPI003AF621E0